MQKISIKNFGPIDSIEELEVSKVLLLIGPQASGKSTISKLIYFFKSLREDVLACLEEHEYVERLTAEVIASTQKKLSPKIRSKFYSYFGSTKDESFTISYSFNDTLRILLVPNGLGSVTTELSETWVQKDFSLLIEKWNQVLHLSHQNRTLPRNSAADDLLRKQEENEIAQLKVEFDQQVSTLFGETSQDHRGMYFIPAGRSLLSSLKQSFQSKFIEELASINRFEQVSILSAFEQQKEVQERKMYFDLFVREFFGTIDETKRILFGKALDQVILEAEILENRRVEKAIEFQTGIRKILKAEYQVDQNGENLFSSKFKKPIPLVYASSGQQEVVWILLTLFKLVLRDQPAFVIIEEPEAHLYPAAQVDVLNLIALFLSANPGNQVIITTHSPYMLTAANNLLFAHRVSEKLVNDTRKAEAIKEVIGTDAFLDPANFGAYYLSEDKIASIFNKETGVISQSELDDASDEIMDKFDALMEIYKSV